MIHYSLRDICQRFVKAMDDKDENGIDLRLYVEWMRIALKDAAPQASNGSPQGSGVGQRQTAPRGEVAESDNAPAAVSAPIHSAPQPHEGEQ